MSRELEQTPIAPIESTPSEGGAAATPVAPEVKQEPEQPLSRRELLAREFKTPTERKPNGQFIPANRRQAAAPAAQSQVPPEKQVAAEIKRLTMPKSLKKELQSHWDTAPMELVNAIAQREADHEKGVAPLLTMKQEHEALMKEFEPYQMLLKSVNATPKQVIGSLLQTAAILRTGTPYEKAMAVAQTMQQYGIPLEYLSQAFQQNPAQRGANGLPAQPAADPQLSELKQQLEQLQQSQQQQETSRAMAAIQEFAAKPEHKHFDAVQDRMLALLQSPHVLGPEFEGASEQAKLKLAYDAAIRMDPAVHQQVLAEQQAKQQQAQQVIKAKNAAVQVAGAPASGPTSKVDPRDRRALIQTLMQSQS